MSRKKIFQEDTAWFSSSVSQKFKNIWKRNGGQGAPLDSAMFVFSQDFNAPDTLQIFRSEAYLSEHLAVLHPLFIIDSVSRGSKTVLMDYKLPPEEVYKATREKEVYKWDSNSTLKENEQESRTGRQTCSRGKLAQTENEDISASGKVKTRKLTTENNDHIELTREKITEKKEAVDIRKKETGLEEICHIDDIPKITGVLEEFIPGQNGCEVFRK
ncbi:telomere repeats-binding bouquet formation protein 2-like [Saccostrea echinata]|uniref:telomere repeats-binding bouquet formation protein 2-like n=1 Tax=Saccostrea echinata TaxID=191078 RepID=UPI002A8152B5|nr:telomere repeats-binding bouquet formation protein 2-like [Saccostrea echinata]